MFRQFSLGISLFLITGTVAHAVDVPANGSVTVTEGIARTYIRAPADNFTGRAWIDPLFLKPQSPQRTTGSFVTFEPGSRTAWHTHPLGQTLVVVSGTGWVQEWNKEKITVHSGDVINFPPGVKHWHGATDKSGMVHLAIQELTPEGKNVNWLEKVSDTQYQ